MKPTLAAVATLGALLAMAGCGGGSGSRSASATDGVSNAGVSMTVPPGWVTKTSTQPVELVLAPTQSDLTADVPTGARIIARPGPAALPSPASLLAGVNASPIVGKVSSTQGAIGGQPEVSVQFNQKTAAGVIETIKTMVTSLSGGRVYVFTLEAPQAGWDQFQLSFATALSGVSFNLSAVPRPS
jgi:hypothetical protein